MVVRIIRLLAVLAIVGALLELGDIAWQLWGTGLQEHAAQARLKTELQHDTPTVAAPNAPSPAPAAIGTPGVGAPVGTLSIPAMNLSEVIVQGTAEAQLAEGPGHYPGTPMPGQAGNVAIAGHRTTYGHPFYDLQVLVPGDQIGITTPFGAWSYTVTGSQIVSPNDSAVLNSVSGKDTLTLTTCNPRYSAAQRLIVYAIQN